MSVPTVMSGVLLTGHGGPEVLVWSDTIPVPRPGPGEVLVRVLAAGVNNTDINTRLGWYAPEVTGATLEGVTAEAGGYAGALRFPRIQGGDLCGRVVTLGDGVAGLEVGARVTCPINQADGTARGYVALGSDYDGAFAQYVVVPGRHLFVVSSSPFSDVEIAAMPCAFGTALNLLTRAGVLAGDRVLVTGASGGVGLAAVILARVLGAEVTGVTDPAKAQVVCDAGAVATLARDDVPAERSFDVVIDVTGGPGWGARLAALRPGGVCAVAGAIAGPVVETDLRRVYLDDLTILGCTHQPPEVFARLVGLINEGRVRPVISRTYPLHEIATAQADFLTKRFPGKLVLIPPETHP
ncbi:MAG: zinc-binding dehydrogenase [Rhodobacterales bacterium]|nr:zinc-binding dehydrogenase [Rhodobacterales bacterium]